MEKEIFINEDLFQTDGDYVLGGFTTTKTGGLSKADVYVSFLERIESLVQDYLQRAEEANQELGFDNPADKAHKDLALILLDNLNIHVELSDTESLVDYIINSDPSQKWLSKMNNRIDEINGENTVDVTLGAVNKVNSMDKSSPEYMNAKYFTEETTLETLIEQLSIIEI